MSPYLYVTALIKRQMDKNKNGVMSERNRRLLYSKITIFKNNKSLNKESKITLRDFIPVYGVAVPHN